MTNKTGKGGGLIELVINGFFWLMDLFKLLQNGIDGPNLKKMG